MVDGVRRVQPQPQPKRGGGQGSTTTTNQPATRSANCTIGARLPAALLDQPHQPADPRRVAHRLDPDQQPCAEIDGAGMDAIARATPTGRDSPVSSD